MTTDDKANLWNKELEQSVLAVLLDGRHAHAWGLLQQVCPHPFYFFSRDHQLIVLLMASLAARGEAIDASSVSTEASRTVYRDAMLTLRNARLLEETGEVASKFWRLPPPPEGTAYEDSVLATLGGYNAITDLSMVFAPVSSLERNAQMVADHYRQRRMVQLLTKSLATMSGPKGAKEIASVASALLESVSSLQAGSRAARNLGQCLTAAVGTAEAQAEQRSLGKAPGASWGIPQLDALCPLRPGMMVVLSAPPGAGKTSLALQCAAATSQVGGKGSVAISSLEMTGEELSTILVARELGIGASSIREWSPAAIRRKDEILAKAAEWSAAESMYVRDLGNGNGESAESVCAWFRQRQLVTGRLSLGVIDYLGLLTGKDRAREYDTLTAATRTIKRAALSLRIPILLLAQMNREGRKADRDKSGAVTTVPEPRLEDLRGSGSIEQDADAVVFMHFPDQKSTAPTLSGRIILAKHRGGATGSIDVTFARRHQLTTYAGLPPEMDEPRRSDLRMSAEPSDEEDMFFGGANP